MLRWLSCAGLIALLLGANVRPAAAAISLDPIASSFIYPVGKPSLAPTWDPANGNGYFITQGFNNSCDPNRGEGYYAYGLYYCGHTGIDLASQGADATVHAVAAGMVMEAAEDGGYGVTVRLRHQLPDGSVVYSQYEHMQCGSLQVYVGQTVTQGQPLGLVGATGFATGTHLHFEIKIIDAGGPGYTFGNQQEIAPFFDPLAFIAAHAVHPSVLVTRKGQAIPEWPAETDVVLHRFLAEYRHFVVVKVTDGLYVHAGPGTRFRVLGVAMRGARLGYLGAQGNWLHVALPQQVRGWVGKDRVAGYRGWATPWPPHGPLAVVNILGLNIHADPGQRHPVTGVCFQGDLVSVAASTSHWTEVRTREGTRGWVLTRYLAEPGSRPRGGGLTILAAAPVLHVRAGPGVQYPVIGSVFSGTPMVVIRFTPHWAAVTLPGGTLGWVARPFTTLPGSRTALHRASLKERRFLPRVYVRVLDDIVNLHSGPSQKYRVVARATKHARLQVLGMSTHWAHVALPASTIQGWVLLRLVR